MQAMCDLFALTRIHSDLMFRNDDYVAGEKAKAIQKLIEALCKELRNIAVPLVSICSSDPAKYEADTHSKRQYIDSCLLQNSELTLTTDISEEFAQMHSYSCISTAMSLMS